MRMYRAGFTFIELLLSIALITIIVSVSAPVVVAFQHQSNLNSAKVVVQEAWRRAQSMSQSGEGDSAWGVNVASGAVTVFKGASFVLRDVLYDEVYDITSSINASGFVEVVFSKLTGFPQSSGTLILTDINNDTQTISINAKGMASY